VILPFDDGVFSRIPRKNSEYDASLTWQQDPSPFLPFVRESSMIDGSLEPTGLKREARPCMPTKSLCSRTFCKKYVHMKLYFELGDDKSLILFQEMVSKTVAHFRFL
jgi:hypothetical protein